MSLNQIKSRKRNKWRNFYDYKSSVWMSHGAQYQKYMIESIFHWQFRISYTWSRSKRTNYCDSCMSDIRNNMAFIWYVLTVAQYIQSKCVLKDEWILHQRMNKWSPIGFAVSSTNLRNGTQKCLNKNNNIKCNNQTKHTFMNNEVWSFHTHLYSNNLRWKYHCLWLFSLLYFCCCFFLFYCIVHSHRLQFDAVPWIFITSYYRLREKKAHTTAIEIKTWMECDKYGGFR